MYIKLQEFYAFANTCSLTFLYHEFKFNRTGDIENDPLSLTGILVTILLLVIVVAVVLGVLCIRRLQKRRGKYMYLFIPSLYTLCQQHEKSTYYCLTFPYHVITIINCVILIKFFLPLFCLLMGIRLKLSEFKSCFSQICYISDKSDMNPSDIVNI